MKGNKMLSPPNTGLKNEHYELSNSKTTDKLFEKLPLTEKPDDLQEFFRGESSGA